MGGILALSSRTVSAIRLVGPGGAGKSTVGRLLAERLAMNFVDLDARFAERHGDITAFLKRYGYIEYARKNVEIYSSLDDRAGDVIPLSSGFMTYPVHVDANYGQLRERIAHSPSTFVLMPSLDREACVAETVRRQLARPFARTRDKEEAVARERFDIYVSLPARKVATMDSPLSIVEELLQLLRIQSVAVEVRREPCQSCPPGPP